MNVNQVYERTSIINVKNKLGIKEIYSSGNTIYAQCPFCNSENASLKLDIAKNTYICNNCEEAGFSIGLYARTKFISNKEAYKRLIKEDADMKCSISRSIIINNKKSDDELDYIYQEFLKKLDLKPNHMMYLLRFGFNLEEIENIGFKTIPSDENIKFRICNELINQGLDLTKTPGFYQNNNFKWTFKSHNGFFIPIKSKGRIIGLRVHLDEQYANETTDIWFSSTNKINGTQANNNIMILCHQKDLIHLINDKEIENDIVVVSEMILAYKVYQIYKDKIVIGLPNVLSKDEIKKLDNIKGISNVLLIMDSHTIKYNSSSLLTSLSNKFGVNNIKTFFSFNNELPKDFITLFEESKIKEKIA